MNELTKKQSTTCDNENETCNTTVATKMSCGFDVRKSSVFYETWYEAISRLSKKEQLKAYKYILEYSFYHIEPEDDKSLSYTIFIMAQPSIDSAQGKYDKSVENGKKGGRPPVANEEFVEKVLQGRKEGKTQKEVAAENGVSIRTIQRIERATRQNHNVNDNDNVNVNDDGNDNNDGSDEPETPAAPQHEYQIKKKNYKEARKAFGLDNKDSDTGNDYDNNSMNVNAMNITQYYTSDELPYEYKKKITNLWSHHKKPKEISKTTNILLDVVNEVIDEYVDNGYRLKIPDDLKIPKYDGTLSGYTKEDFSNFEDSSKEELKDIYDIIVDPNGQHQFDPEYVAQWFKKDYNVDIKV